MKQKYHSWAFARNRYQAIIAERFSASYMSNAKWVKLLDALTAIGEHIHCCKLKLVWDDSERTLRIDEYLVYGFDYYQCAMEALVSGEPRGWYDYREIEWLGFPNADQDVEQIAAQLATVGLFKLEQGPDMLKLIAYQ